MSKTLTPDVSRGRLAPAVQTRLAALRQAYLVHTLKRTIADVMATEERDYSDFGLDKREVLAGLQHLLDTVRTRCGSLTANDSALRTQTRSATDSTITAVRRRSGTGRSSALAFMARRALLRPAA